MSENSQWNFTVVFFENNFLFLSQFSVQATFKKILTGSHYKILNQKLMTSQNFLNFRQGVISSYIWLVIKDGMLKTMIAVVFCNSVRIETTLCEAWVSFAEFLHYFLSILAAKQEMIVDHLNIWKLNVTHTNSLKPNVSDFMKGRLYM